MRSPRYPAILLAMSLAAGGCGRAAPPAPVAAATLPCLLLPEAAAPDTVTIGVTDSLNLSDAPVPRTEGERLVYGLLFPGLARLDCGGRPVPGLARDWALEPDGRWRIRLRDAARFSDGTPVSAERVAAAWETEGAETKARVGLVSVDPADSRTLLLTLDPPSDSFPRFLASEAFAPVLRLPDDQPRGGGEYHIGPEGGAGLLLLPGSGRSRLPVLRIRTAPGADPRDLLDEGADLVVTNDPATIEYARSRPGFSALPLPWNRVYLLVLPAGREATAPEPLRTALAGDAVRVEARAAVDSLPLRTPAARTVRSGASPHLVYPAGDRTAGELARRLVALAARSGIGSSPGWIGRVLPAGRTLVAMGLAPDAFARALQSGDDAGYIMSRGPVLPPGLPAGTVAVPLIETRSRAVIRSGTGGLEIQGDGTLRVRRIAP